jgi:ankyrin repeat protein
MIMAKMQPRLALASLILALGLNVGAGPLHQAVTEKSQIDNGADIDQLGPSWYEYGSPLHLAVQANQQDIAQLLIDEGATVDVRDTSDYTPLHNAAWNGNLEMVKLLLDSGADIDARSYSGDTPLSCAYRKKRTDVIQFIETRLQSTAN